MSETSEDTLELMRDGHLAPDAVAGLAMGLVEGPEGEAAQAHARECAACAAALAEGERRLAVLDDLAEPPAPSKQVLHRARAAVLAQMASEDKASARKAMADPEGSSAWGWPLLILAGLGTLALTVLGIVHAAPGEAPWTADLVKCGVIELVAASLPLLAVVGLGRAGQAQVGPAEGAAAAGLGGVAGMLFLHISCHNGHVEHLFVSHLGVVLVAMLLGAFASKLAAPRARS